MAGHRVSLFFVIDSTLSKRKRERERERVKEGKRARGREKGEEKGRKGKGGKGERGGKEGKEREEGRRRQTASSSRGVVLLDVMSGTHRAPLFHNYAHGDAEPCTSTSIYYRETKKYRPLMREVLRLALSHALTHAHIRQAAP